MTYQRMVNRNGLVPGKSDRWRPTVNLDNPGLLTTATGEQATKDSPEFFAVMGPTWRKRLQDYDRAASLLLDDLRRLEADALDEGSLCVEIARRSGVDTDTVAAVLQTFFSC